jgi:multiple sugar transport system substrate-binding protein
MKNRNFRVLLSLVFVLALFLPTLAYCSPKEKQLTWASWTIAEEALKPIYMSMLTTFMDKHPNVKIKPVTYPYAQYLDQLIISAASGNAPDIAHIKAEWLPQFVKMAAEKDLTTVLSKKLKRDYYPDILNNVTVKGKILAAPWFSSPCALYYNKTLLKKAGITKLPANWDQLMTDARKISALGKDKNGNKIYGYALPNSKTEPGNGYNCFPHLWSYGGDFTDKNGKVVLNSSKNLAAFTEIKSLFRDGISPNGCTLKDLRNLFAQGVIGFYYDLEAIGKTFVAASPLGKDFVNEYGVMVIPSKKGPHGYGYVTEHYLIVYKTIAKKNLDVIGDLMDHFTGSTCMKILYDGGMGKMPDRVSVTKLDIFSNPTNKNTKAFVDALASARALPTNNANFKVADEYLNDALVKLAISDEPVKKVLTELDSKVKKLYGQ